MPTPLDDYKALIDDLAERRDDVSARWVTENRPWPDAPENEPINVFVSSLTDSQRKVLARLLQDARDSGFHDVLAYLNEKIDLGALRLIKNGRELPHQPFGTEMHYDWICRIEGDPWPEPDKEA